MHLSCLARAVALSLLPLFFIDSAALGQQTNDAAQVPQLTAASPSEGLLLRRAKENFSSLSLKDSELNAEPPLLGEKGERPEFTRELFQVRWRPNDPIDLYVIRPRGVKKPPVVLYLYGYPSDTDRFKDAGYCARVVRHGVAAVGFVSALTGQRTEHRSPKEWFVGNLQESLAETAHDVQMILNYLETRGDLDMNRVGIFGEGSGGAIAILAATADHRIKKLDLLRPWGDWQDWLATSALIPQEERSAFLKQDFLKQLEPLEPVRFLPELKDQTMRIQIVDTETDTKKSFAKLESVAPSSAKIVHYRDGIEFRKAASDGHVFDWLATELNGAKQETTSPQSAGKSAALPNQLDAQ